MNAKASKIALVIIIIGLIAAAHMAGLTQQLTLDNIRTQHEALLSFYQESPWLVSSIFFFAYITVTALSLPGAAVMTLAAGALFGFWIGFFLVSFASTIGATLAFLISRYLIGSWVQEKYKKQLAAFNEGFRKEGLFYLFGMRLMPVFPFFLINILMGLTPVKVWHYYIVSQLSMIPGTMIYVFAGTELGKLSSVSDILSPQIIIAFTLLGFFPLIAKKVMGYLRKRRKA